MPHGRGRVGAVLGRIVGEGHVDGGGRDRARRRRLEELVYPTADGDKIDPWCAPVDSGTARVGTRGRPGAERGRRGEMERQRLLRSYFVQSGGLKFQNHIIKKRDFYL